MTTRSSRDWLHAKLLLDTIAELHGSPDPAAALPTILDRVLELTQAERGQLLLRAHGGDGLEVTLARTRDGEDIAQVEGSSQSIPQKVFETGEAVCITGTPDDWEQASSSMLKHDLASVLCVPIRQRGSVRGVIYVDSQEVSAEFGDHEREFLEALATQCAIALEAAQARQAEAARSRRLEDENAALKGETAVRPLAVSEAMQEAIRRLERVADSDLTLLITGETGVGKEVLARYVHALSRRRAAPFVVVDCGAVPGALLESVLFGHVKGAFTGATADKAGLVRAAAGGTLLLDEIGELPLELQPKLLRLLEERTVLPVGSEAREQVDVRVVACTHRDLAAMVAEGAFREDLRFRLGSVPLELPPLRERAADVLPLARLFLSRERSARLLDFTHEAQAALRAHAWPGNVRELAHRVQRAAVVAEPPFVTVADLDLQAAPEAMVGVAPLKAARRAASDRFEREYVTELLSRHKGKVVKAAQEAGVSRQLLQRLMARHGIARSAFLE